LIKDGANRVVADDAEIRGRCKLISN
jgi:hypothetical protein